LRRFASSIALAACLLTGMIAGPAAAAEPDPHAGALDQNGQLRLRGFSLTSMKAHIAEQAPKKPFKLFYSFNFANQPVELEKCGLTRMPLLTPGLFFKSSKVLDRVDRTYADTRLPLVKQVMATGAPIGVINIEGPWTIKRTDTPAMVQAKIDSHQDLIAYLKSRLGNKVKLGVYGEAPLKDFFSYQTDYFGSPLDPQYADFLKAPGLAKPVNAQIKRLAASTDALFPPYYVFWYDNLGTTPAQRYQLTMQSWTTMAQQSLKLALAWKKPVYPFIWMQYHNKINDLAFPNKFLTKGFFRYQLDTLKKLGSDGVVIWGSLGEHNGREKFDRNADWWKEYLAFAKENGADLRKCPHMPD
jgi:hypothetical protein